MDITQKQKERLLRIKRIADEGDIGIAKELNAIEDKVEDVVEQIVAIAESVNSKPELDEDEIIESILSRIELPKDGEPGRDGKDGANGKDGLNGKDGVDGIDGKDGKDGADGKDGSPDTPDQIVAKLSSLEGEDRLDASAIKGLTELIEEAKRLLTPTRVGGFLGGRVAHIPMVDDFSELTDGSTKTFYLSKAPRSTTTIKIWGSDFPYILRPNTDFTVVGKLLTLTAQVDAPTTGATLIVEYYV